MTRDGKPVVLLIVEDDREMRSLLRDDLCSLGVLIREAEDGDMALQTVLDAPPDAVVTDLRMPAGGLDYLARLRAFAPTVPIVVMTSFGDAKTKADVLATGVSAYFDKPLRLAELRAKLTELLAPSIDGQVGK
ncbi:response regulator [Nitrospira sp.]|nr:response regulator [Nitrospira sp.]